MDWKTLRHERLGKAASGTTGRQRDRGWRVVANRLVDRWRRPWTVTSRGRWIIIGGVLALLLVPVSVIALTGGNGDSQAQLSGPVPSATALPRTPTPTSTTIRSVVEPTAALTEVEPSPTPKPPPDRRDCDKISGTAYRSSTEREWFLANCLEPTPAEAGAPAEATVPPSQSNGEPARPSTPPPTSPQSPAPSATPSVHLSAAEAIDLAVEWIANEARLGYSLTGAPCSARRTASLSWVVSCEAVPQGCHGSECQPILLSICIIEDEPPTVWLCS